jgi:uncharacterized membrane protein
MTSESHPHQTYPIERLAALSDGVFAIVLTLLVLDLKVPDAPGAGDPVLSADLAAQLPNFVAWLLSFALVARFWVVHQAIVGSLARCHIGTIIRNLVVLGLMSLVPFAASLIGRHGFDALAVSVFSLLMAAAGLSIGLFARHAATDVHLHGEHPAEDLLWQWNYHTRALPAVAVVSVVLLGVNELAGLAVWGLEPALAFAAATRRRR